MKYGDQHKWEPARGVLILLVLLAFFAVSSFTYEDEVAEQDFYCQMVAEGTWPDEKGVCPHE